MTKLNENLSSRYHKALRSAMEKRGLMDISKIDETHDSLYKDDDDMYAMSGKLIDAYMLSHPLFKEIWTGMTGNERWIFVHDMHYGIEQSVRVKAEFKLMPEDLFENYKEMLKRKELADASRHD